MKCIICTAFNTQKEALKHPNAQTFFNHELKLRKLKDKDPKAITSICEEHRNPLVFNTVVTTLFKNIKLVGQICIQGIPLEKLPKEIQNQIL